MPTSTQEKRKTPTKASAQKSEDASTGCSPASNVPIQPGDQQEVFDLYDKLQHHHAHWIGPDGEQRGVPASLHSFLLELLDALASRKSVLILRDQAALSTIQASDLLGVSRQFFMGLLEKGEIPFHLVGTHHRVYARDLFRYKLQRDARRAKAIRDLAKAEHKEGLYDRMPALDDGDPR